MHKISAVSYMKLEDWFANLKTLLGGDNADFNAEIQKIDDRALLVGENGCYSIINFTDDTIYLLSTSEKKTNDRKDKTGCFTN